MKPTPNTYTVIKTYLNKRGKRATYSTGIVGGTEKEAVQLFNGNRVAAYTTHKQIVGLALVDAADNLIAEWTKPAVEMEAA